MHRAPLPAPLGSRSHHRAGKEDPTSQMQHHISPRPVPCGPQRPVSVVMLPCTLSRALPRGRLHVAASTCLRLQVSPPPRVRARSAPRPRPRRACVRAGRHCATPVVGSVARLPRAPPTPTGVTCHVAPREVV